MTTRRRSRTARRLHWERTRNMEYPLQVRTPDVHWETVRIPPGMYAEGGRSVGHDQYDFHTDWVRECDDHVATARLGGDRRRRRLKAG